MKIRDILQAILDGKEDDIEVVVRCKDCKYWVRANGRKDGFCENTKCFDRLWGENDWCSYGKRKESKFDYLDKNDTGTPKMVQERIIKDVKYADGKFASFIMGDLIRCRDCKHFEEHKGYGNLGESAYTCQHNMDGWIYPTDYCSNGVRKDV